MDLDVRMKKYEFVSRNYLTNKIPVIIRIDGRAFHTFTKGFNKPFDDLLSSVMAQTTEFLCRNIQNCVFGYTQSDEISLLLIDSKTIETSPWFDNCVQKIVSLSSSMTTLYFNRGFEKNMGSTNPLYLTSNQKGATFDSRAFNIPKEEVVNYFIWRQEDATRNSIQMLGQSNFSNKQLQNKSCDNIQEMLFQEKGINWNNLPTKNKRGVACYKIPTNISTENGNTIRNKFIVDYNIPIFTQDRNFIEKHI